MATRPRVTGTPGWPSGRLLLEPSGFTGRSPGVSTTTVHVAPAGIEPRGSPFASSLRNSSPSPPSETPAAAATRPMRNSGSAPGVTGCGRAQAAAAAARLVSQRLAQCRVQLCDGEVDIGIGVRAGDEAGLERRGSEEDAARERGPVPARAQRRVRALRVREVPDGSGGDVLTPHRSRMTTRDGNPTPARGVPYTRHQPRG